VEQAREIRMGKGHYYLWCAYSRLKKDSYKVNAIQNL